MSSQRQLADYGADPEPVEGQDTLDARAWDPGASVSVVDSDGDEREIDTSQSNRCGNCGNHVDPAFARVFGDEDGRVDRCFSCGAGFQVFRGAAAGKDVREARSQSTNRGGGR